MKAKVKGKTYQGESWKSIVSAVLIAERQFAIRQERELAAKQLSRGLTAVIGGVLIKPEGARE
jgi:hypothetical protein